MSNMAFTELRRAGWIQSRIKTNSSWIAAIDIKTCSV